MRGVPAGTTEVCGWPRPSLPGLGIRDGGASAPRSPPRDGGASASLSHYLCLDTAGKVEEERGMTSDKPSGLWGAGLPPVTPPNVDPQCGAGGCANHHRSMIRATFGPTSGRGGRRKSPRGDRSAAQDCNPRRAGSRSIVTPGAGARSDRGVFCLVRVRGLGVEAVRPVGLAEKPHDVVSPCSTAEVSRKSWNCWYDQGKGSSRRQASARTRFK